MPWKTPTLRQVRELVRDDVSAALSGAAMVGNNVLRVMADAKAGMAHLVLRYIDWLALQLMPDTAEKEWLDRHGDIWLTNADGTVGRKSASYATGTVTIEGTPLVTVPMATELVGPNGVNYETTQQITISSTGIVDIGVRALEPGEAGNVLANTAFGLALPLEGVTAIFATYDFEDGTEEETDEQLRIRVLERIQMPPMGGDKEDYINWTLRVNGVSRAWSFPLEMGIGTVTVRFMMDDLRDDNDGFPLETDITTVTEYLDTVRPVAVKDFFVVAPIKQPITWILSDLDPDNATVRANIEVSVRDMLRRKAAPGQTIFAVWKAEAVLVTPEVKSFKLVDNDDDVMPSPGHLAILGDIQYESPA